MPFLLQKVPCKEEEEVTSENYNLTVSFRILDCSKC